MSEFIGYTAGLNCRIGERVIMTKIEYSRTGSGVRLQAVSGNNLARFSDRYSTVISEEQYAERPLDPFDSLVEAKWALASVGVR